MKFKLYKTLCPSYFWVKGVFVLEENFMKDKTIAAISTARGQGGVGIIRISGEDAIKIADKIFVSINGKSLLDTPGYRAKYGKVMDEDECIDEAIALVFRAPHSYTGENVVEISCHGGIFVTNQILKLAVKNGASLAEPGEFTQRAFLNGKMDLTEAESVMDIISAQGRQAAKAAIYTHEGALSKKVNLIKEKLISIASHLDAFADYPEDEIPEVRLDVLKTDLLKILSDLKKLIKTYDAGKILREGIDTVIVGKPNVGKSTLMNLMLGRERCIVTDIPGTTRDLVEENLMLGDIMLKVSDTAGIRDTDDLVEKIGVDLARKKVKEAQLVLAVFDYSKALNDDDKDLILKLKDTESIAIVNKVDLKKAIDTDFIEKNLKNVIYISAREDESLNKLEKIITEIFKINNFDPTQGILSNQRQYFAVNKARENIGEALEALEMGVTLDAITVLIEESINSILKLTGEKATDAVINEVFSRFCVGK